MFNLGVSSWSELRTVHPTLVLIVSRAIRITKQDFTVHDGARSLAEQRKHVASGASQTLNSNHLVREDGYGYAVDLVPWSGGKLRWEWPLIYPIAVAMWSTAHELGAKLVWGGVWDRPMDEYASPDPESMRLAVQKYQARHPGPDFIDGPHYQLMV